ncbi:MAG TPA: M28 family metallopeptidase [Flavobacterium sp.]|nr:M28 family metallopeptidase [Flavobacterium sp.]
MKKIFFLFATIAFVICCSNKLPKDTTDSITKYINSIKEEDLKTNLYVIASDEMEGRETGSKGQKKAGEYLIEQYKKHKIPYPTGAKSYYQKVPAAYLNAKRNENLLDSENIWAFIEGTEKPNEIVVISAHYDHVGMQNEEVFNGADDDGSGTVAILEIAKAFKLAKKNGHGPKRSILILHFTGEEHGLHGSRYYSENPLFPLSNTVANVNIDMIGRRDQFHANSNNYIYLIGSDYLSSDLHKICEASNSKYTQLDIDYKYNDKNSPERFYYRSDHYNFAKNGIPSVFLFNGTHADYHKATDDVDKIEFDALKKRTQLAFAIAWNIANAPNKLKVDIKN